MADTAAAAAVPDYDDDEEEVTPQVRAETDLSADVLAALQEHMASQARSREWVDTEGEVDADFGMSQFWYTQETSIGLLREALAHVEEQEEGDGGIVAVLSAPSLMAAAVELEGGAHQDKIRLFEYDERFGVKYPDHFHFYDYNSPTDLPPELLGRCAAVVLDPPYLNVPTLREFFVSARLLAKKPENAVGGDKDAPPCIVVTAAVLKDEVREEFGLRPVQGFEVEHTHKLGNPLLAYTNYPPKHFSRASWEEGD